MTLVHRLVAAATVCVLLAWAPPAAAASRVIFTIDVESNEQFSLPGQVDAVCTDGSACGLMEIVRMLNARHWPGTFFLDVYEHRQWGEAAMRTIATGLQDAGQDVALHTHPQWAYDRARWAMHEYSLDEQIAIVRDGKRLLEQWTGMPVVAHRAGAYTADERTLIALQRNGVLLDSSFFWQYPHNRLGGLGLPRNLPSHYGDVVEIPVTAYLREDRPAHLGGLFAPVTSVRKIDPNWFISAAEARSAIDGAVSANVPVIVVFLHSYSFMTAAGGGGVAAADRQALEMFRVILEQVASHGLRVVTMRAIADEMRVVQSSGADVMPQIPVSIGVPTYAWHRLKTVGRGARITGVVFAVLFAGALAGLVLRRRETPRSAEDADAAVLRRTRVGAQ